MSDLSDRAKRFGWTADDIRVIKRKSKNQTQDAIRPESSDTTSTKLKAEESGGTTRVPRPDGQ